MHAKDMARLLEEAASLLEIAGGNPHKARAFQRAARTLRGLGDTDFDGMVASGKLLEQPGIGTAIYGHVREMARSGSFQDLEALRKQVPDSQKRMLKIPGLSAKRVRLLAEALDIRTTQGLEHAIASGRLAAVKGFGPKTIARIREGIALVHERSRLIRYDIAHTRAESLRLYLADALARPVYITGTLRRFNEVVPSVKLLLQSTRLDADKAAVRAYPGWLKVADIDAGTVAFQLSENISGAIRLVPPASLYTQLLFMTGASRHITHLQQRARRMGMKLTAEGLYMDGRQLEISDERQIYTYLDIPQYIAPELREDLGEIAAALDGRLPQLVTCRDIRGVFHCHTTMSDGTVPLEKLVTIAREHNLSYIGVADHSQSAPYANGLDEERVKQQWARIDAINSRQRDVRLLKGVESDILPDGRLDYGNAFLAGFDFVIGSIHSHFSLDRDRMTRRIITALGHPYLSFLGHPTGRLLQERSPYPVDMEAVIDAAIANGKAIEINCHPMRMDIDWHTLKAALAKGLISLISLDAHDRVEYNHLHIGCRIARKAWARPGDILNCRSADDVLAFFAAQRSGCSRQVNTPDTTTAKDAGWNPTR